MHNMIYAGVYLKLNENKMRCFLISFLNWRSKFITRIISFTKENS